MDNENIWKIGLVVLVLIAIVGIFYNNADRNVEDITGMTTKPPYWEQSGNNTIFYNDGYVGIGTSKPLSRLHVVGSFRTDTITSMAIYSAGRVTANELYVSKGSRTRFVDFIGSSSAYVCVTKDGYLYRSNTDCKISTSTSPSGSTTPSSNIS